MSKHTFTIPLGTITDLAASMAVSAEEASTKLAAISKGLHGGKIGSVSGYAQGGMIPSYKWTDELIDPIAYDDFAYPPSIDVITDKRGKAYPVPPAFPGGYPTPYIGRGSHQFDQYSKPRVGCTMELVSILGDRRIWTDRPNWTTADLLSTVMIEVNDTIDDHHRQEMLHFVPRLLGANMMTREIEKMIMEYQRRIARLRAVPVPDSPCPCGGPHMAPRGPGIVTDPDKTLQLVGEMLDHYDAMAGRQLRRLSSEDLTRIGVALAA